jgi:hypothetical protein
MFPTQVSSKTLETCCKHCQKTLSKDIFKKTLIFIVIQNIRCYYVKWNAVLIEIDNATFFKEETTLCL